MKDVGKIGELIIQNFVDTNFTDILSFPNPKNKKNEEICDILIWQNFTVYLCEIKTRKTRIADYGWIKDKISQSVEQLTSSYKKIMDEDEIFLVNSKYNIPFDCKNIHEVIGIIILVYDNEIDIKPSDVSPEIYKKEFPIHTFSSNMFFRLKDEIKSLMDLHYYLEDRFNFLKTFDISLINEINALGYYKENEYKFPTEDIDFKNHWEHYKQHKAFEIYNRDLKSKYIHWIDTMEKQLQNSLNKGDQKRYDNIPLGLFFCWELSTFDFSMRISIGKKFSDLNDWFNKGNTSRKFALQNPITGNILLFYISVSKEDKIYNELIQITRLKYIQAKTDDNFSQGVYATAFNYNTETKKISMEMFLVMGDAELGEISDYEKIESKKIWGNRSKIELSEY